MLLRWIFEPEPQLLEQTLKMPQVVISQSVGHTVLFAQIVMFWSIGHSAPPYAGWVITVRSWVWKPPPQLREHELHWPKAVTLQSTSQWLRLQAR
jgi:hypothetical protein